MSKDERKEPIDLTPDQLAQIYGGVDAASGPVSTVPDGVPVLCW